MQKQINNRINFNQESFNPHSDYYKLNIKRIGATAPQVPSIIKNISMKSFHNTVVEIAEMDIEKAFGFKD